MKTTLGDSVLYFFVLFSLGISITDSAPSKYGQSTVDDSELQFNDDWNYETIPESTPWINGSRAARYLPAVYSYSKNLKVEELRKNDTNLHKKIQNTREAKYSGDIIRSSVSCGACTLGVGLLHTEVKMGTEFADIKEKFVSLCTMFKISTRRVCTGVFDIYGPEVIPVLNITQMDPTEVCQLFIGASCGTTTNPAHEWKIDLPNVPKPAKIEADLPKPRLPVFKVLHITDTHHDPQYLAGTVANCAEPLCCHNDSTPTEEPVELAGRWGSYKKCDMPQMLIDHMLRHIALEHEDIDYIIWTGDVPPHDIWEQSKENNLNIIKDSVEQLFDMFPNVPIFPSIGNHESSPAGSFAPPWMKNADHSITWLYNEMADHWRRWLPASAGNTVLHGMFYSVLLRPGFRLISLNTNYCHNLNWWLFVNSTDPAKELKWLVHELQEAENRSEKVHIIGHIAPGSSDCLKAWSENFYKIIDRYESTVVAQFYGHSHADEFEMFYDTQEYSRSTNVAYLAPSVTTYQDFNPAYRIYYIDGDHGNSTREVLDHETWIADLDHANRDQNEPIWYRLYSARDAYQMKSLRPQEWGDLVERMIGNEDLFDTFYRNYYRNSVNTPHCDLKCRSQILCDLKSGKSQSRKQLCHDLELAFGARK